MTEILPVYEPAVDLEGELAGLEQACGSPDGPVRLEMESALHIYSKLGFSQEKAVECGRRALPG